MSYRMLVLLIALVPLAFSQSKFRYIRFNSRWEVHPLKLATSSCTLQSSHSIEINYITLLSS